MGECASRPHTRFGSPQAPNDGVFCRDSSPSIEPLILRHRTASGCPSGRDALSATSRGCLQRSFVKSCGAPSPKNLPPPRSLSARHYPSTGMTRTSAALSVVSLVQASPGRASARPRRQPQPPTHSHAQRRSSASAVKHGVRAHQRTIVFSHGVALFTRPAGPETEPRALSLGSRRVVPRRHPAYRPPKPELACAPTGAEANSNLAEHLVSQRADRRVLGGPADIEHTARASVGRPARTKPPNTLVQVLFADRNAPFPPRRAPTLTGKAHDRSDVDPSRAELAARSGKA